MVCHKDILRANIARFTTRFVKVLREALRFICSITTSKLKSFFSSYRLCPPYVACPAIGKNIPTFP